MLGNRECCYPLTVSDYSSRFLPAGEGFNALNRHLHGSERVFKDYGL